MSWPTASIFCDWNNASRALPIVYTKLTWNEKTRKARWGERDAALNAAKLKKLIDTLKSRAEATK